MTAERTVSQNDRLSAFEDLEHAVAIARIAHPRHRPEIDLQALSPLHRSVAALLMDGASSREVRGIMRMSHPQFKEAIQAIGEISNSHNYCGAVLE